MRDTILFDIQIQADIQVVKVQRDQNVIENTVRHGQLAGFKQSCVLMDQN